MNTFITFLLSFLMEMDRLSIQVIFTREVLRIIHVLRYSKVLDKSLALIELYIFVFYLWQMLVKGFQTAIQILCYPLYLHYLQIYALGFYYYCYYFTTIYCYVVLFHPFFLLLQFCFILHTIL